MEQLLERQPWESLRPFLLGTGVAVEEALERLRNYARMLLEWNRGVSNIMSGNDEARIVERHLLESIAPAQWLRECGARRWLDFGSGAGFPALPLAIAGVGGRWTLVESRRSKTLFIRKALQVMVLTDLDVVNDRLENVAMDPIRMAAFDGFTSRATLRLTPTLALAARLVGPGGGAFLWKGSGHQQEKEQNPAWRANWDSTGLLAVGTGPNVVAGFVRKSNE